MFTKKIFLFILAFSIVALAGTNAQNKNDAPKKGATQTTVQHGPRYVDSNGDGICDRLRDGSCGCGLNYVDADGDGVCDNLANGKLGNGKATGDRPLDGTGRKLGKRWQTK